MHTIPDNTSTLQHDVAGFGVLHRRDSTIILAYSSDKQHGSTFPLRTSDTNLDSASI